MKTIWDYILYKSEEEFDMPKSARILNVQVQQDKIFIWALVDTDREMERRTFKIIGTDHQIHFCTDKYIGTFQTDLGTLHLFEITEKENDSFKK